jgi:Fe-S cluster assembly ATP-binding protein
MLEINDLYVEVEGKSIIRGLNLKIHKGETHAIMGPNGAGKSTLGKVLAGHPDYMVVGGSITYEGKNLLDWAPEERAHAGVFLSFQYPPEIPGVSLAQFLLEALNARKKTSNEKLLSSEEFALLLDEKLTLLSMQEQFKERGLNEGFSGGEKKKCEILQMALLDPHLTILDEIDSGLDIDAMRVVADGVKQVMNKDKALLVITHYQRLLNYLKPDVVHIFSEGKILLSGGADLALKLEKEGYEWICKK